MSTKKNLPNIPIYIGDWERDCNVLSLESEAAWMRIIFKLWSKGKQNTIKIPTKSLQNLWRCSPEKMNEILEELIYNEIAVIKQSERFIEFTCRRFVKENKLSEVRSKAGKSSKKKTNAKQNKSKSEQNTEIDTDNESEYENEEKGSLREKTNSEEFFEIQDLKTQIKNEFTWRETIYRNYKEVLPDFTLDILDSYLDQFFKQIENDGETEKTIKDAKKHFSRWLNYKIEKQNGKSTTDTEQKIGRQTIDDIKSDLTGWEPD
jgi:uncharacterized protein YdaU (DUF1376 family)